MTDDDLERLRAIIGASDGKTLVQLIQDYYRDLDRAQRTSRATLYLHLGMLSGALIQAIHELETR
jgi:hypothetical protein